MKPRNIFLGTNRDVRYNRGSIITDRFLLIPVPDVDNVMIMKNYDFFFQTFPTQSETLRKK